VGGKTPANDETRQSRYPMWKWERAISCYNMSMIGIYKITNKTNGKRYIGQSINIEKRFKDHKTPSRRKFGALGKAFAKYGVQNFDFEIIEICEARNLDKREMYYIAKLKPEYNISAGGTGNRSKVSEEVKQRLSLKGKQQWARMSPEAKEKQIKHNLIGPAANHKVSNATRDKLRLANLGKKQSEETRSKRKATIKQSGYVRTNQGHQKPIRCIETGETFQSLKEAQEKHNINTLCGHLKGRYKTCKNRHYEYVV